MIKLIITNIDKYIYKLKDNNGKEYTLMLEFYELENDLAVGDTIYLDNSYLKEPALYSFGPLNEKYGKNINSENDKDLIIIRKDTKDIYLKRFYG